MSETIERMIPAFRTAMAGELLKFKYSGTFMDFARNVTRRRTMFSQELQHLRIQNQGRDQIIAMIDAAEAQIAKIARETIENASTAPDKETA